VSWIVRREDGSLRSALYVIVLVVGCSDVFSSAKSVSSAKSRADSSEQAAGLASRPPAEAAAAAASVRPPEAANVLEHPAAFGRFFESLARLEAGQMQDDVRIVQFGDSHTAADIETAVVRQALQARFGDGGRGFVAIGKPWKGYRQDGVRGGMSSGWFSERGKLDHGQFFGDGLYGLAGIGVASNGQSARAWADCTVPANRVELAYLEQPHGGSFDVFIDGTRLGRISTRAKHEGSAYRSFDIAESTAYRVEVRNVGDGNVRIFGVSLDRSQNGVVFDALGINGARVTTCLQWNEPHWVEQLRHRSPSLVVLSYGTNESTNESMSVDTYEGQLVDVLGRIARAVPSASCLLLGPPDRAVPDGTGGWITSSKLLEIIASQKRVAQAAGCAFYDQFQAMGGAGTMATWSTEDPPRAQRDRVHLTRDGYTQLGGLFASDVMRAYDAFRRDRGLAPTSAPLPSATSEP